MSVWNNQSIVDLLVSLWDEGRTGTEIAQTIEVRFGVLVTRNAVIAKLDRIGKIGSRGRGQGQQALSRAQKEARQKTFRKNMQAKVEAAKKPAAEPEPPKPQGWFAMQTKPREVTPYVERQARVFDPAKMVTFDELEGHHCRWPIGDPRDSAAFRFCGEAKVIGLPYCRQCATTAYRQPEPASHHGVNARPVSSAAGGQTRPEGGTETQESIPAAGEALEEEMEEA